MSEIIKQNELKADPAKVREMIEKVASGYEDPSAVLNWYYSDQKNLAEVESLSLEDNVVDWVLEHANVTDKACTFDEIMNKGQTAAQLLYLESENPDKDIHFYINSPGGSVSAGMAIYDTMQFIKPNVSTMCVGQAASMGALLLTGGEKGKRFCLPHSRVMIHQPLGGFQGQASDIDIHAREILYIRERLNAILAKHTGQAIETIQKDTERDNFMSAETAKDYGLIDDVLHERAVLPETTQKETGQDS